MLVMIDFEYDCVDFECGNKVVCLLCVLWGEYGIVGCCFDLFDEWWCVVCDVSGCVFDCGYYIFEEVLVVLIDELFVFFDVCDVVV